MNNEQTNITNDQQPTVEKPAISLLPGDNVEKLYNIAYLLNLKDSGIEHASEAMRGLNEDNIVSLTSADFEKLDPVEIVHTTKGDYVIDGYHRIAAATRLGHETIKGIARTYPTMRDMINKAFSSNIHHGYAATPVFRTRYALWLLDEAAKNNETLGIRAAARQAGVSHVAVNNAIARRKKKDELPEGATDDIEETEKEEIENGPAKQEKSETDHANTTDKVMEAFTRSMRTSFNLLSSLPDEDASELIQQYLTTVPDLDVLEYMSRIIPVALKARRAREEKARKASARTIATASKNEGATKPAKARKVDQTVNQLPTVETDEPA